MSTSGPSKKYFASLTLNSFSVKEKTFYDSKKQYVLDYLNNEPDAKQAFHEACGGKPAVTRRCLVYTNLKIAAEKEEERAKQAMDEITALTREIELKQREIDDVKKVAARGMSSTLRF